MARILVTGGCGFIGHHLVEHVQKNTDWEIVVLDKLNYASFGLDRLRDIPMDPKRTTVLTWDFTQPITPGLAREIGDVDYIVHMGAETHVDNSIAEPKPFIMSNVVGTMEMLQFARTMPNLKKFVYFSTDEVFGPAREGTAFKDWDRYNSTNPYSATKAGGEELALAWANTYKVPVVITHCMNVFGERQHPEKFIPLVMNKVLNGEKVTIHSYPDKKKAGSRSYIHARNVSSAVLFLLEKGEFREKYNISGEKELSNLELAQFIADTIGKPLKYEMVDFHSMRPGHDLRYALDDSKLKGMGWESPVGFEDSMKKTIEWTLENKKWLTTGDGQEKPN